MADVYAVFDERDRSSLAIKVLRRSMTRDEEAVSRFEREAEVQRRIDHPNVAKIYGSGITEEDEPYLRLELLRGYSLRDVINAEGRVDVIRACSYVWQALQGLAATHSRGVLHRDLKPANLMLEPSNGPTERVVLIDFGFASLDGAAKLTQKGQVVGSLSYMAPERLQGQEPDERTDLYSLGVILFELLVGKRPFGGKSDYALIAAQVDEPAPSPREFVKEIPPALEAVVMRSLAKRPAGRAANALAMARELEEAAQSYRG